MECPALRSHLTVSAGVIPWSIYNVLWQNARCFENERLLDIKENSAESTFEMVWIFKGLTSWQFLTRFEVLNYGLLSKSWLSARQRDYDVRRTEIVHLPIIQLSSYFFPLTNALLSKTSTKFADLSTLDSQLLLVRRMCRRMEEKLETQYFYRYKIYNRLTINLRLIPPIQSNVLSTRSCI